MSKLDDIFDEMNMVEHGAFPDFLLSEDGISISAEKTRKYLHRKFKRLMLELIGDMEERETEDMSLKSWTKEDHQAFGRNMLRSKLIEKVSKL